MLYRRDAILAVRFFPSTVFRATGTHALAWGGFQGAVHRAANSAFFDPLAARYLRLKAPQASQKCHSFKNSNPLKLSYARRLFSPPMEREDSTVPVLNSSPRMGSRRTTVICMSL